MRSEALAEPPANASHVELLNFLTRRAAIRDSLGMTTATIEDRRKLVELNRGKYLEFKYLEDLASAQSIAGNYTDYLRIRQEILKNPYVGRGVEGAQWAKNAHMYAQLGDIAQAKTALATAERIFPQHATNDILVFFPSYEMACKWALAGILRAQGKYAEADASMKRALVLYAQFLKNMQGQITPEGAPAMEMLYSMADILDQEYTRNLVSMGRLIDAEIAARNMLKRNLSRVGRYTATTAFSTVQLSDVLLAQGRIQESNLLADVALDIVEHAGISHQSRVVFDVTAVAYQQPHRPGRLEQRNERYPETPSCRRHRPIPERPGARFERLGACTGESWEEHTLASK